MLPLSKKQIYDVIKGKLSWLESKLPEAWVEYHKNGKDKGLYQEYMNLAMEIRDLYCQLKDIRGSNVSIFEK